jgi:hypothetical protein
MIWGRIPGERETPAHPQTEVIAQFNIDSHSNNVIINRGTIFTFIYAKRWHIHKNTTQNNNSTRVDGPLLEL